jgi:Protein of unknown function (DUF4230)
MATSGKQKVTEPLPAERELVVRIDPRRGVWVLVAVLIGIIALLLAGRTFSVFPSWANPFADKTVDRSQPALLESVQDLSRYEAAAGNYEVIVDVEKDAKFLPSAIKGERTLFVAAGSVDVYVDFAGISGDALTVSADRRTVELRLPRPALEKPNLDHDRSYVFARQIGVLDKLQALTGGDTNREQQLYQLAETKLADAAARSDLAQRAEKNTRAMLEGLFKSLGFTTVKISYDAP